MIPQTYGFCLCRALAVLGLCVCLGALAHEALAADLSTWAARVIADGNQPAWKQQLAQSALDGARRPITMRTTWYCPIDAIGGPTGGGYWGCTWTEPSGRRLPGMRLRWGYVAADRRHWPTGSVFYAPPPYDRTWIVADRGPGVKGRDRVDIHCPGWPEVNHYKAWTRAANSTRLRVYYLGRITRAQALGGHQ